MRMSPLPTARDGRSAAAARLERAIDSAVVVLERLERTRSVRDLAERARQLKEQIAAWQAAPPSSEEREAVMRDALSIHLSALALLRGGAQPDPPDTGDKAAG
jgi:hypothetical protein